MCVYAENIDKVASNRNEGELTVDAAAAAAAAALTTKRHIMRTHSCVRLCVPCVKTQLAGLPWFGFVFFFYLFFFSTNDTKSNS